MKFILAAAVLAFSMQWAAGVMAATGDELPTAADLYAQAGDPAVVAPTETGTAAVTAPTPTSTGEQPAAAAFAPDQLEQLVAPIALYPDALLMQILMASTYPLEIVEADRWISQQTDLKGDALDKALLEKDWDPSVKSLCTLPDVLKRMSENLDWTQDLGDAFLAQQNDLLDTVQVMRGKAYEAGNLASTEQQKVTQNADKIIVIEQASPEVVYVPAYSPTVVYGASWGYPSYYYPPMYPVYPPGYGLVSFGVGVAVGAALWGGCNWGWGNNDVNIDIDRNTEFNRNTNNNFNGERGDRGQGDRGQGNRGQGGKESWQHDSSHRKGVNYKDSGVAQKYGAGAGSNRVTKDQARGRQSGATASNRAGGAQQGNRQAAGATASNRSGGAQQGNRQASDASNRSSSGAQQRSSSAASSRPSSSQANRSKSGGSSAYSGSRSPSSDRMSSSRGASSRGASSYGGSRGGGGGRGGGGRRR